MTSPELRAIWALALAACGPSIAVIDGEPDTTGAGPSATSMPEPGTSEPMSPPGSGSTGEGGGDSSGTAADTSTADDGDAGCGFLCAPDAAAESCDLFAQNCPPGEKCMPWANDGGPAWNATRCSPLAKDPTQAGEECKVEGSGVSGIDNCDVGLMCWNVDENGTGMCEDICTGSADLPICEDPEDFCVMANDGVIALCLFACHPLLHDCPVQNEVCYPIGEHWACAPDRQSKGRGHPCAFVNQCGAGDVCISKAAFTSCLGDWSCCTSLCDLNDDAADAFCQALDPAQTCEPWYAEGQAPVGYGNVGVCMIAGAAP